MKNRVFVFYRYTNKRTGKMVENNMPKHDWDRIQRDPQRSQQFMFLREVDLDNPEQRQSAKPPATKSHFGTPIEEDPLECPLCGVVAKDEEELKKHKAEHE